jgi:hypothetical protein
VSKEIDSTIRFSHTSAWQATLMNSCAQCSRAVNPKRRGVARDCEELSSGERPLNSDGGKRVFKCLECFVPRMVLDQGGCEYKVALVPRPLQGG